MDYAKLRAWWFHRQSLERNSSSISESLTCHSRARSVGGASPYLALFARRLATRQVVDDLVVAEPEIHELPAARGCTYVVPAPAYALALKAGALFADGDIKSARKLGVIDSEIDKLGSAVIDALAKGTLDPDGLKLALGAKVRNLGEEGKKKGVATTLPLALGLLQTQGEIRRIPVNGRLDNQRYRYALWRPNPLTKNPSGDTFAELARRYFDWTGSATPAEFQWFCGLGVKVAKAAFEPLNLVDAGDGRLLPLALADEFAAFQVPQKTHYALVSSVDSAFELRRNLTSLVDDLDAQIPRHRGPVAVGKIFGLPSHAILDRGRLVGVWQYDVNTASIAWKTFQKPDVAVKMTVKAMEHFLKSDLGNARSFSLDSPKLRAPASRPCGTAHECDRNRRSFIRRGFLYAREHGTILLASGSQS